jgi:DNA gyrase inhibitor GyrI
MNLTETPEVITWPVTLCAFIEKVGPFQKTAPQAWQEMGRLMQVLPKEAQVLGRMSLYRVETETYRAAVALASKPSNLPAGLHVEEFKGGKYARFVLRGPWSDLPAASGRVFEIVRQTKLPLRDAFCIENYVTAPTTPQDQQVTHILIPMA